MTDPSHNSKVSVIVPNYNYGHFLLETINSVLSQSYRNLECIIVDDGSTDNSKVLIEKLKTNDARVKGVYKMNGGLSSARNAGIRVASGEFISFLDADDLWKIDKLKNQLKCFEQYQDTDFVFSNYEGFYPDGKIEPFVHTFGDTGPFDFIKQNPIAGSASSVLLKRALVEKTGFFDESLKSTEDHDYWFRCLVNGAVIKFCDHYDILIRLHASSMSENVKRMNEYNHKVFVKQLTSFKGEFKRRDLKKFRDLTSSKIQSLLWIARETKDFVRILNLYRTHFKFLGLSYTGKTFLKNNFLYDLRFFLKRAK